MKKRLIKKLFSPIVTGLAVFAVFGLALYAYAAVTIQYPPEPGPVTGIVGQLVGFSATAVNGNQGGYKSANALCNTAVPDSHICMSEEITRSYAYDNATLAAAQADTSLDTPEEYFLWINSGAPGYTANVNDCLGWNTANAASYGAIWNLDNNSFAINGCNSLRRFACCK